MLEIEPAIVDGNNTYNRYWVSHIDIRSFVPNGVATLNALLKPYNDISGEISDAKYWVNIAIEDLLYEVGNDNVMKNAYGAIMAALHNKVIGE